MVRSSLRRRRRSELAVRHWSRLLGGLLYATSSRLEWSKLLRHTFDIDTLDCTKCHGRLRSVATIADMHEAHRILERLGVPSDAPQAARARDPTYLDDASRRPTGCAALRRSAELLGGPALSRPRSSAELPAVQRSARLRARRLAEQREVGDRDLDRGFARACDAPDLHDYLRVLRAGRV